MPFSIFCFHTIKWLYVTLKMNLLSPVFKSFKIPLQISRLSRIYYTIIFELRQFANSNVALQVISFFYRFTRCSRTSRWFRTIVYIHRIRWLPLPTISGRSSSAGDLAAASNQPVREGIPEEDVRTYARAIPRRIFAGGSGCGRDRRIMLVRIREGGGELYTREGREKSSRSSPLLRDRCPKARRVLFFSSSFLHLTIYPRYTHTVYIRACAEGGSYIFKERESSPFLVFFPRL